MGFFALMVLCWPVLNRWCWCCFSSGNRIAGYVDGKSTDFDCIWVTSTGSLHCHVRKLQGTTIIRFERRTSWRSSETVLVLSWCFFLMKSTYSETRIIVEHSCAPVPKTHEKIPNPKKERTILQLSAFSFVVDFRQCTPLKLNIDTKNGALETGNSFEKW